MEYLFIYCLQVFDDIEAIRVFCTIFGVILLLVTVAVYIGFESERKYYDKNDNLFADKVESLLKKITITFISIATVFCFIPTKKTLLVMGGLYLGKKAVNQVITDEKIKKIDTIINLELDKRIKELRGDIK